MTQESISPFRGRKARSAKVEVTQNAPITEDMVFQAEHEGRRRRTVEDIPDADLQGANYAGGTVEHTRPATVVMWKPTPLGFFPRVVSASAIGHNLRNGWRSACPDCHSQHSADPNTCPNREPIAVRVCPLVECRKRIYDNAVKSGATGDDYADDPNVINDDAYEGSTPASRTKRLLDMHLWLKHPRWAQLHNVEPLPTALREIVEGTRPV